MHKSKKAHWIISWARRVPSVIPIPRQRTLVCSEIIHNKQRIASVHAEKVDCILCNSLSFSSSCLSTPLNGEHATLSRRPLVFARLAAKAKISISMTTRKKREEIRSMRWKQQTNIQFKIFYLVSEGKKRSFVIPFVIKNLHILFSSEKRRDTHRREARERTCVCACVYGVALQEYVCDAANY